MEGVLGTPLTLSYKKRVNFIIDQFLLPLLHDELGGSTNFHFGLGIITKNSLNTSGPHVSQCQYPLSLSNTGGQQLTDTPSVPKKTQFLGSSV